MAIKIKDKSTLFLLGFLGLILIYSVLVNYFRHQVRTKYSYNTATLTEVEYIGRSASNRAVYTYLYNSEIKKGRNYFPNDSTGYYKSQIGKRFLVKMSDKPWVNRIFFTYELYINKPVPDSIEAPIEGWKELPDWARE